jgi:hypothetical protein
MKRGIMFSLNKFKDSVKNKNEAKPKKKGVNACES